MASAARDKYDIRYTCRNCGAKGVVHYSENEEEVNGSLDVRIEKVEGDVEAKHAGENKVEVTCKKCGKTIPH